MDYIKVDITLNYISVFRISNMGIKGHLFVDWYFAIFSKQLDTNHWKTNLRV